MLTYYLKRLLSKSTINTPKFSLNGKLVYCKVVKVYDGDTITVNFKLFRKIRQFNIRMAGYDTPELRSKDPAEKEKAILAKFFLQNILLDKIVYLKCLDFDKYGRLLGEVHLSKKQYLSGTPCVNQSMISTGHAVPYFGGTK